MQSSEVGDAYTYLAFKRETQFFICFVVGKWNDLTCNLFYEVLAGRLRFPAMKRKLTIFSDGNRQNFTGIANNFPQSSYNHAIRKKIRINHEIVGVVSKTISGNVNKAEVGITQVDGFCSKLRERISCFTRKARSFAKRKLCIEQRLEIFSVQHNFIEVKKGKTPAMREGLHSKPLSWETFFQIRLSILN